MRVVQVYCQIHLVMYIRPNWTCFCLLFNFMRLGHLVWNHHQHFGHVNHDFSFCTFNILYAIWQFSNSWTRRTCASVACELFEDKLTMSSSMMLIHFYKTSWTLGYVTPPTIQIKNIFLSQNKFYLILRTMGLWLILRTRIIIIHSFPLQ